MNSYKPLLSIITPTRNNASDIIRFLNSIKKQTYKNIELIISDGMSTDDTRKLARKYRAIILDNKKKLAEPGVTLGMQKATGDLMMILAVDNVYEDKNALKKMIEVFKDKNI